MVDVGTMCTLLSPQTTDPEPVPELDHDPTSDEDPDYSPSKEAPFQEDQDEWPDLDV